MVVAEGHCSAAHKAFAVAGRKTFAAAGHKAFAVAGHKTFAAAGHKAVAVTGRKTFAAAGRNPESDRPKANQRVEGFWRDQ